MDSFTEYQLKKDPNYLNNLLSLRKNEYDMLQKTAIEMKRKGKSSNEAISMVERDLNRLTQEMKNIEGDIKHLREKNNCKTKANNVSFFDKIDKGDAIKESAPITYHRGTPFKTECRDIGNGIGCFETSTLEDDGVNKRITNELTHKIKTVPFDDDLGYSEGDIIRSSSFIASFLNGIKIQPWRIRDVTFNDTYDTLNITMLDCIMNVNGKRVPLIKVLRDLMDNEVTMTFSVKHMDGNGTIKYEEQFYGCKINSFSRGGLSADGNINAKNESRFYVSLSYGVIRYIVN